MKKMLLILPILVAFLAGSAHASFTVQEDGTSEGEAIYLNVSSDLDVSVSEGVATITQEAALAPTSVTVSTTLTSQGTTTLGDGDSDKTTVVGQLYIPYYSKTGKAASGTSEGTIIMSKGLSRGDCGHGTTGNSNVRTVCFSDGTDWIAV